MSPQQFSLRWNNHTKNLVQVFADQFEQQQHVDVTISCQGRFLKAHKIVLGACSPYFQELFDTHESATHPIIIMNGYNFEDIRSIVEFMYRGEVMVAETAMQRLLAAAEDLQIKGLSNVRSKRDSDRFDDDEQEDGGGGDDDEQVDQHQERDGTRSRSNSGGGGGVEQMEQQQQPKSFIKKRKRARTQSYDNEMKRKLRIQSTTNQQQQQKYSPPQQDVPPPPSQSSPSSSDKDASSSLVNKADLMMTINIEPPAADDDSKEQISDELQQQQQQQQQPPPIIAPKEEQKEKIPRPPNSFMIFANEWRRQLASQFPNESNKEISVRLGVMWKNLTEEVKAKYFNAARRANDDHKKKYPDYHYNPKEARMRKMFKLQQQSMGHLVTASHH